MIDPNERERAALKEAMNFMTELMAEIGWHKRFNELTADQAAALAESAVDGFLYAITRSAPKPDEDEVPFG